MNGYTLDAGALIALERDDRTVTKLLLDALHDEVGIVVPAGVLGQVWRSGSRQVRLTRLLAKDEVEIEPLDDLRARAAGQLCGLSRTRDVIDASVVLCARTRGHRVVTSDPVDLLRLDPTLVVIVV
jgi:hypothetical protein